MSSLPRCRTIWSPVKWSSDCITLFTFHTWKLVALFILSVFMNIPSLFFCHVKSLTNNSRTSKLWNKNFCCLLYLWMQIWRRIQKDCKSNSLICSVIVILPENVWKKLARPWSPLTQTKDFCAQILWVKNDCDIFPWLYVGIFFLMKGNKIHLTDGNLNPYFECGVPVSIQWKQCFRECREHTKDYATRGHPSTMHRWRTHRCSSQTCWPLHSLPSDCTMFNYC